MARAIDANKLEIFPYSEGAGTEEQIEDWIEQVGLSGDDTASRARNLCWKVIDGCINVVKTQPTLTQPNEPLTLEELREMNGEPVWVKRLKGLSVCDTDWAVVEFRLEPDVKHDKIRVWWPGSEDEDTPSEDDYGKTWIAYRRPPEVEEEEKHVIEITENL